MVLNCANCWKSNGYNYPHHEMIHNQKYSMDLCYHWLKCMPVTELFWYLQFNNKLLQYYSNCLKLFLVLHPLWIVNHWIKFFSLVICNELTWDFRNLPSFTFIYYHSMHIKLHWIFSMGHTYINPKVFRNCRIKWIS